MKFFKERKKRELLLRLAGCRAQLKVVTELDARVDQTIYDKTIIRCRTEIGMIEFELSEYYGMEFKS